MLADAVWLLADVGRSCREIVSRCIDVDRMIEVWARKRYIALLQPGDGNEDTPAPELVLFQL